MASLLPWSYSIWVNTNSAFYVNSIVGCQHFTIKGSIYCCCSVPKLCPTLFNPLDCGPSGFSIHGILQAKLLEWISIPFFRISPTQGSNLHLWHCRQDSFVFFKFKFYWRIIALQNFTVFCQTPIWISHRYTYVPSLSWTSLPPPTPPHASRLSHSTKVGFPASYSKFHWLSYADGSVCVSVLLSQIFPPSPSRTVSKSLFSHVFVN